MLWYDETKFLEDIEERVKAAARTSICCRRRSAAGAASSGTRAMAPAVRCARALRLLARWLHVFATALLVYAALKAAVALGLQSTAAWEAVHTWCARRLLGLSRTRKGL